MVIGGDGQLKALTWFASLAQFLPPRALLVVNDARVTPARLLGRRLGGGKVELLILDPPVGTFSGPLDRLCLGKPGRNLKPGTELTFEKNDLKLEARVVEAESDGPHRLIRFFFQSDPASVLDALGHLPLPPYIRRPDRPDDFDRYQTVYAKSPGAVAAPTAGLHFTREHLKTLKEAGFETVSVSLRVGAGTFAPLTSAMLQEGRLHEEWVEVGPEAVLAVRRAQEEGRTVVAIGTTAARALEWASEGGIIKPKKGGCTLFIRPGFRFQTVEALITNFHLPGSSLMYLVGALAGRETILKAYAQAIEAEFRFYSYGDAMLLLPQFDKC
jgi:S-adenosylmethionine:tRNA ribosyltransferase-isomerase